MGLHTEFQLLLPVCCIPEMYTCTSKSEDKSGRHKIIQVRLYSSVLLNSLRSYVLNLILAQSRDINLHFE